MSTKILWPLTIFLGIVVGFAVCSLVRIGGKDLSRSAIEKAERMESLAVNLGAIVEEERGIRAALEEHVGKLESNLRAATDTAIDFEVKFAELSIRYREVENALADIGVELGDVAGNISGVAVDIGGVIDGVESSTATPGP